MIAVNGKYGEANIACDCVESTALSQIYDLMNSPVATNANVRIMPDVHAGAGCVIGLSMVVNGRQTKEGYDGLIIPNLIGVDIGCGVLATKIDRKEVNFPDIDNFIRGNIPVGKNIHSGMCSALNIYTFSQIEQELEDIYCPVNVTRAMKSVATLGGGNHFIEISSDSSGDLWLIIHSGSRHLGLEVATYYQNKAKVNCDSLKIKKELSFISDDDCLDYLHDMKIAQKYAEWNRLAISKQILDFIDTERVDVIESVHNYIDFSRKDKLPILRKGAVSAYKDQALIIPMNMRDGSLLCIGKGNEEWNCTAPHGAGRLLARKAAKEILTMEDFSNDMDGIYTTCITEGTLDESPRAYKPVRDIMENIDQMVEVIDILKPLYNFKAS